MYEVLSLNTYFGSFSTRHFNEFNFDLRVFHLRRMPLNFAQRYYSYRLLNTVSSTQYTCCISRGPTEYRPLGPKAYRIVFVSPQTPALNAWWVFAKIPLNTIRYRIWSRKIMNFVLVSLSPPVEMNTQFSLTKSLSLAIRWLSQLVYLSIYHI